MSEVVGLMRMSGVDEEWIDISSHGYSRRTLSCFNPDFFLDEWTPSFEETNRLLEESARGEVVFELVVRTVVLDEAEE